VGGLGSARERRGVAGPHGHAAFGIVVDEPGGDELREVDVVEGDGGALDGAVRGGVDGGIALDRGSVGGQRTELDGVLERTEVLESVLTP
jgi:hypothetical protein